MMYVNTNGLKPILYVMFVYVDMDGQHHEEFR